MGPDGQKALLVNSQTTGTGPDGYDISHTGMYTLVWPSGPGCASLNGALTVAGSGVYAGTTTQIANFLTCTGMCPLAGTATTPFPGGGGSATISVNGTNIATCMATSGGSSSIPLNCP